MPTDTTKSLATQSYIGTQGPLKVYSVIIIPVSSKETSSRGPAFDETVTIQFTSVDRVEARQFPDITIGSEALSLVGLPVTVEALALSFRFQRPISTVVTPHWCDQWAIRDPNASMHPPGSVYVRGLGSRATSQFNGAIQDSSDPNLWVFKSKNVLFPYVGTTEMVKADCATRFDLFGDDKLPRGSLVASLTQDKCSLLDTRGKSCKRTPKENIWDDWDPREAEGAYNLAEKEVQYYISVKNAFGRSASLRCFYILTLDESASTRGFLMA